MKITGFIPANETSEKTFKLKEDEIKFTKYGLRILK